MYTTIKSIKGEIIKEPTEEQRKSEYCHDMYHCWLYDLLESQGFDMSKPIKSIYDKNKPGFNIVYEQDKD